jgi:hypothetical protein
MAKNQTRRLTDDLNGRQETKTKAAALTSLSKRLRSASAA